LNAAQPSYSQNAEKLLVKDFDNLYKINDGLYRSEQPHKNEFIALEKMGIVTILNLREKVKDDKKIKKTNHLLLKQLPIKTNKMSNADIFEALQIIQQSEEPILVHCLHGADRTGVVVAAYRMVMDNWSKQDAIQEFRLEQFGYHKKAFPELLTLLEQLDVDALKKQLKVLN